jgi:hypothetical protein
MASDKTALARIEQLLVAIDSKITDLTSRMKDVETVANDVKQNPSRIADHERRITLLEVCQTSGKASSDTLRLIWEILNKPIVIAVLIGLWAYIKWGLK